MDFGLPFFLKKKGSGVFDGGEPHSSSGHIWPTIPHRKGVRNQKSVSHCGGQISSNGMLPTLIEGENMQQIRVSRLCNRGGAPDVNEILDHMRESGDGSGRSWGQGEGPGCWTCRRRAAGVAQWCVSNGLWSGLLHGTPSLLGSIRPTILCVKPLPGERGR